MDLTAERVPAVTLVVASYNHQRFVERALSSAFSQDYSNVHVIIIDDASTDASQSEIKRILQENGWHAELIFHERNRGVCASFNEALVRVDTPYVAFISADDWQELDRISKHVAVLDDYPNASLVYGPVNLVSEDGDLLGLSMEQYYGRSWPGGASDRLFIRLLEGNWIPAPSVLSRTDSLRAVGGFDESLPYEDYDMLLRLARESEFAFHPEALVNYRIVPGSLSHERLPAGVADVATKLKVYEKHLGSDDAADAWLVPRLFVWAVASYKNGAAPASVARVLRGVARRRPSLRTVTFAALTSLGIPWRQRSSSTS